MKRGKKANAKKKLTPPIKHWSHSSLMAFLRNPLAWYKRYVEEIYDMPTTPAAVVGSAGHIALEHFYRGWNKEDAIQKGLEYMRGVADFEINFGKVNSSSGGAFARKKKRKTMEQEYIRAISFYLKRPPRHKVLGVEVRGTVRVDSLPLPIKAVSDLVVESNIEKGSVDIVDHKFVTSFSNPKSTKALFIIQAIFNYYTIKEIFNMPVRRFIIYECKKTKNADGSSQMRRHEIDFKNCNDDFAVFNRLINDATTEISRPRIYLPNPSDMFEGENSFDIYRLGLTDG